MTVFPFSFTCRIQGLQLRQQLPPSLVAVFLTLSLVPHQVLGITSASSSTWVLIDLSGPLPYFLLSVSPQLQNSSRPRQSSCLPEGCLKSPAFLLPLSHPFSSYQSVASKMHTGTSCSSAQSAVPPLAQNGHSAFHVI